jgi:hypothetical protein
MVTMLQKYPRASTARSKQQPLLWGAEMDTAETQPPTRADAKMDRRKVTGASHGAARR